MQKLDQEHILSRLAFAGQRGWYIDEFGSLLRQMLNPRNPNANYRDFLRTVDDSPDIYMNSTNSREDEKIYHPYLPILACFTPADLSNAVSSSSTLWLDGFFARFLFISANEDYVNSDRFPDGELVFPKSLIEPLVAFNQRLGQPTITINGALPVVEFPSPFIVHISPEAQIAYNNYDEAIIEMTACSTNHALDGNYSRFPEKALRIAALLASVENKHSIGIPEWVKAQSLTEHFREGLHTAYNQTIETHERRYISNDQKIKNVINLKISPTRREISQRTRLSADKVQESLDSLIADKQVNPIKVGKTTRFRLADEVPKSSG
jgi:hypothetical protein